MTDQQQTFAERYPDEAPEGCVCVGSACCCDPLIGCRGWCNTDEEIEEAAKGFRGNA